MRRRQREGRRGLAHGDISWQVTGSSETMGYNEKITVRMDF